MIPNILGYYSLTNYSVQQVNVGLVHETYLIKADEGDFILQRLNRIFDDKVIKNVDSVSNYLNQHYFLAQTVIKTITGYLGVDPKWGCDKRWWRLLSYVPGRVFEKAESDDMVYSCGIILGKFHCLMRGYHGELDPGRRVHDTCRHFELFKEKVLVGSGSEIDSLCNTILEIPNLLLPTDLKVEITHGDPKISNIVFANHAVAECLIDLDGCNRQNNIFIELGDAFRSWCNVGYEDGISNLFDLNKFKAGWSGYLEVCGSDFDSERRLLVPRAIKLITLELASRFLRDYFEDFYFGWDSSRYRSRKDHNLARAKGQIALFNDICAKDSDLLRILGCA